MKYEIGEYLMTTKKNLVIVENEEIKVLAWQVSPSWASETYQGKDFLSSKIVHMLSTNSIDMWIDILTWNWPLKKWQLQLHYIQDFDSPAH